MTCGFWYQAAVFVFVCVTLLATMAAAMVGMVFFSEWVDRRVAKRLP